MDQLPPAIGELEHSFFLDIAFATMIDQTDTIVALATPPGKGALGLIRLSGERSISIVDKIFNGADLGQAASHSIHYGSIRDDTTHVIDEVVVFLFKNPRSYTGEDIVEISCHGSSYILQEVLDLCTTHGARLAQPGEFTMRAFMHGKMDLSQAEAVGDLIASTTAAAHKLAVSQMRGGLSEKIKSLRGQLVHFASMMELELDFGEEDVEFANRDELKALVAETLTHIESLIQSFKLGNAIKQGVHTVIAGRPNAGKSTLLNRLLDEDRAIVSEIAGTTRDTIEENLNIQGIAFRLIDTAGIREAQDQIEQLGVEKTMQKIEEAAILLYVFDATQMSAQDLAEDLEKLQHPDLSTLVIANKMDRNPYATADEFQSDWLNPDAFIPISALNNMNIEYLKERLYQAATGDHAAGADVIVANTRHLQALQKTHASLTRVVEGFEQQVTSDFIAMDIRQSTQHLGEITGEISTDDLLEHIFSTFCIGK